MLKPERIFVDLVESILSQQLSGKAANTIITRVKKLSKVNITPDWLLSIDDWTLRDCGVSWQKIKYLKDLSAKTLDNTLQLYKLTDMMDEQIIEHLIVVKGIGRWTAEMMLIFTFGRPDVFPVDDLGIQNAMIKKYGLRKGKMLKAKMQKIADKHRPHRTTFARSLWNYLDNLDNRS